MSLEKQADHGSSLEAQHARLEAYAVLYQLALVEIVVDPGLSARTLERPGLSRALGLLAEGQADALLVTKLDRLTRSVRDLGDLVARYFSEGQAALLSISEHVDTRSAAGRLVLNVLTSVAQWEREATSERTSSVLRHMAQRGEYTGGRAPYGFAVDADGRLSGVPAEQLVISRARELHAEGFSLRSISNNLAVHGHFARTGRAFAPAQIRRMLGGHHEPSSKK